MLSVKRFFMFFVTAKGAFSLLYSMLAGRAAHQTFFAYSGFNAFHCYNVPHKRRFVNPL